VVVIAREEDEGELRAAIGDLATPLEYAIDTSGFCIIGGAEPWRTDA
jgi:hypothetical protein